MEPRTAVRSDRWRVLDRRPQSVVCELSRQHTARTLWGNDQNRLFGDSRGSARGTARARALRISRRDLKSRSAGADAPIEANLSPRSRASGPGSPMAGRIRVRLPGPASRRFRKARPAAGDGGSLDAQWLLYGVPSSRAESTRVSQVCPGAVIATGDGSGAVGGADGRAVEERRSDGTGAAARRSKARGGLQA